MKESILAVITGNEEILFRGGILSANANESFGMALLQTIIELYVTIYGDFALQLHVLNHTNNSTRGQSNSPKLWENKLQITPMTDMCSSIYKYTNH